MIMLKNIVECDSQTLEMDEYVPFTIEFGSKPLQLIYWRGGDGTLSLIEIGLNMKSGAIHSVSLVSINPMDVSETKEQYTKSLPEKIGLPIFDITDWNVNDTSEYSNRFQDEFCSGISLAIGSNFLVVSFKNAEGPVQYVRDDQVRFGFSQKGELSTLEINWLMEGQIEALKKAI
ncbi:hypothetical protein SESI111939_22800 [Serratia silvae]